MKKIFLALGLTMLLATSCNQAAQQTNQSTQTPKTVLYTNTENGYQLNIPESWTIINDGTNNLLSFKTIDGHTVYLVKDDFGPMDLPKPLEPTHPTTIGKEAGYIDSAYHCGDGSVKDPQCTGALIFQSQEMSSKGFALEFHIEGVASEKVKADSDPYADFNTDVKNLEQTLSTFEFTK